MFFSEEIGYWVVSRYEDIKAIFKDPATFSSENTQEPYKPRPPEVARIFAEAGVSHASSGLSGRQPPTTPGCAASSQGVHPAAHRRARARRPQARDRDDRALRVRGPRRSRHRPGLRAARPRGLPARRGPRLRRPMVKQWAASRVMLTFGDLPVEEQVRHAENLAAYWRYCVALVESRLEHPQDDLTGALAEIYLRGDQSISIDEMAGLIHTQLFAGHETTTGLLGEGLKELLRQPGAGPSSVPTVADPQRGGGDAARGAARVHLAAADHGTGAGRRRRARRRGQHPHAARLGEPRRDRLRGRRAHRPAPRELARAPRLRPRDPLLPGRSLAGSRPAWSSRSSPRASRRCTWSTASASSTRQTRPSAGPGTCWWSGRSPSCSAWMRVAGDVAAVGGKAARARRA